MTGEELANEELVALLHQRLPDILLEGFPDISLDELVEQLRRQPDWLPDIALKELITLVCEFVASKGGRGSWRPFRLAAHCGTMSGIRFGRQKTQ